MLNEIHVVVDVMIHMWIIWAVIGSLLAAGIFSSIMSAGKADMQDEDPLYYYGVDKDGNVEYRRL